MCALDAGDQGCLPTLPRTHGIIDYMVFPFHGCSVVYLVLRLLTFLDNLGKWIVVHDVNNFLRRNSFTLLLQIAFQVWPPCYYQGCWPLLPFSLQPGVFYFCCCYHHTQLDSVSSLLEKGKQLSLALWPARLSVNRKGEGQLILTHFVQRFALTCRLCRGTSGVVTIPHYLLNEWLVLFACHEDPKE